jgi:hypothetical protein
MGMVRVTIAGSFKEKNGEKTFSDGHADAVARAIEYLSSEVLPFATALDHKLHSEGVTPEDGFERKK